MSLALGCVAENTPKYLGQAVRLVQSIRWFGGALNEAELYVCVVDDIRQDFREELERYDATIHVVPRFSTKHPQSNKLRFLDLPDIARHDRVLLLDCDTIVVRDPSSDLFRADFTAKIADIPTVPPDTFRRIFAAFGLSMPEADQRCTVRGEPTIPYFNAGVLAFSRRGMDILVPKWIELNEQLIARMELLDGHENFCEQASLSLALAATGINFDVVGNAFNFPMHFDNPATAQGLADTEPFIIHYHWLVDPSGYILPSAYPAVNSRIDEFNARLRQERESLFDNRLFWNQRYAENPELGSGVGSRGEARDYKRHLLEEAAAWWAPRTILDVGCGDLEVGSALPTDGYTGLDFSEVVVATNREKFPDRVFLAGNFLEMERARADMVVCLDVLIHLASPDEYRNFVSKLVRSTSKVGIVAGDETAPGLSGIVFFHEPLSRTLADAGATNVRKIGSYRHVTIFEFTPRVSDQQAALPHEVSILEGSGQSRDIFPGSLNDSLQRTGHRFNLPGQEISTVRTAIDKKAIIVLGMHRSGTSALTGVLSLLGAESGPSLLPAHEAVNPKGYWEHADVVSVHEELLFALGSSWHDTRPLPNDWWKSSTVVPFRTSLLGILCRDFSESRLWVLKDPRMCRLLPMWLDIFKNLGVSPHFIISMRSPFEVAKSLECRDELPEVWSCLLWLDHLLKAEQWTRDYPRVVVAYERLLTDWRATSRVIAENLSLPLNIEDPVVAGKIDSFLEPSLRHHDSSQEVLSGNRLTQLATEAYQITVNTPIGHLADVLSPIVQELEQMSTIYAPWMTQIQALNRLVKVLKTKNNQLEQEADVEITRIKSTVSWRITAPLRAAWNFYRKLILRKSIN